MFQNRRKAKRTFRFNQVQQASAQRSVLSHISIEVIFKVTSDCLFSLLQSKEDKLALQLAVKCLHIAAFESFMKEQATHLLSLKLRRLVALALFVGKRPLKCLRYVVSTLVHADKDSSWTWQLVSSLY